MGNFYILITKKKIMVKGKATKSKFKKNDGTSRTFHLVSAPVLQGENAEQKSYLQPFVPSNALKKGNVSEKFDKLYTPIKGLENSNVLEQTISSMTSKKRPNQRKIKEQKEQF